MIILTGGAGFIGSCFLAELNKHGLTDILVVDNLTNPEKSRNLEGKRYTDFAHKDAFRKTVQANGLPGKIDAIVHLGACTSTTETDVEYLHQNNFQYSKELAEYALSRGIYFMYASSAAIYGNGELGFSDREAETARFRPLNAYADSKQQFDSWSIEKGLTDRMLGLRYFNVFGPNEYHKGDMRSVVRKAFEQIRDTGKVQLFKSYKPGYSDGEQRRDFIYVRDVVNAMWAFFNRRTVSGIVNLGTGKSRTWNDLTRAVFFAMDKTPDIEFIEMPETLRAKYQYVTEADTAKLISLWPEARFSTLEESVTDYVRNFMLTPQPYL